ncbi:MAG: L,D-transpeptidase, partial [Candidatus Dormibacteraeota bacterium]|nr:L,D-transpeptidase [Candidatus Dormibacteraeota bacterium]
AEVSGYGGVSGLLSDAQNELTVAQSDNLDTGQVSQLIAQVQNEYQSGSDASPEIQQLVVADASLHNLVSLNNSVGGLLRPIELSAAQASAEGTPNADSFQSQYSSVSSAYHNAQTAAQLNAVQSSASGLQNSINAELAANVCGHDVGSGKVITINLSLQEGVFYQDGCVVRATPVTTGRPALPTPAGHFSVFYKQSPFQMISPWPMGSPFYYDPTWVTWVMEFDSGGYFIHDAYWEGSGQYGPGGEYGSGASHGCIHIPTDVMQWLYSWTPMGTPVIIT